jgi:SAM-dependent methyltransferase
MKFISYIKYFFYLAYNWNISIAWHIIKQEINGEKKYGIHTTGADELKKLEELGIDITHATIYMPVSYSLLEEIFRQLPSSLVNHFLDMGCGKGRAMCVAARNGFKHVTGIDFSKELCDVAKINLTLTKEQIPALHFKIINNDAFYFDIPDDVDCIFFFNPFDEIIMTAVVSNILKSLQSHPRKLNIIYVNPLHKDLFLKAGFKEAWYSKKMKYLEVSILE